MWVGNLLQGDFGTSIYTRRPVTELIGQRIGPTLTLATTSMLFVITVAIPMGIVAAWRAGSWMDLTIMALAVFGFSFPVFWLGLVMIYVFSVKLEWLPVQGFHALQDGFLPFVSHLLLPTLSIGIILIALLANHPSQRDRDPGSRLHPHRVCQGPARTRRPLWPRIEERGGAHCQPWSR